MTKLVTLDEAKVHLRVDHDEDDADITLKLEAASAAVLGYLKDASLTYVDTSGEVIAEIPFELKAATLLMLGDLYKNREPAADDPVDPQWGYGYLPRAVIGLLYRFRVPTVQ